MAIAPFHLWGLLSNHEQHFCESYYLAFFACAIPTVRFLVLPIFFPHDLIDIVITM
jgi:hypothetical protein